VNALIPGLIDTALTRHEERYAQAIQEAGQTPAGSPGDEEKARQILTAKTPLGVPWIEPEDVAPVVVFLASDVRAALQRALEHRGPALVDVVTDPNALSLLRPHITAQQAEKFALSMGKLVRSGHVDE
jgi:NAD(P)-dependent dehydrogenase (short-subunit alcohol dehydrogenase family)